MYWPVGAPRIYATSSNTTSQAHVYDVDEEPELPEDTDSSASLLIKPEPAVCIDDASNEAVGDPATPITPITPGIIPVEHDTQSRLTARFQTKSLASSFCPRRESANHLLALRVSRSGLLFAIITATSLTIWQTKVCTWKPLTATHD